MLCSPRWLLKQEVPKIVKSINRQLREKSIKTKVRADTCHGLRVACSKNCMPSLRWIVPTPYRKYIKCITFVCLQVGAFSVLRELVVVLPDCLSEQIGSLIPGIEKALNVSEFSSSQMCITGAWFSLSHCLSLIGAIFPVQHSSGQIFDLKFEDWGSYFYKIGSGFAFTSCFPPLYQGN
jgi:hypothetical protein